MSNSLSFSSIPAMMSRILGLTTEKEKTGQVALSPVKSAVHCHCCRQRSRQTREHSARHPGWGEGMPSTSPPTHHLQIIGLRTMSTTTDRESHVVAKPAGPLKEEGHVSYHMTISVFDNVSRPDENMISVTTIGRFGPQRAVFCNHGPRTELLGFLSAKCTSKNKGWLS